MLKCARRTLIFSTLLLEGTPKGRGLPWFTPPIPLPTTPSRWIVRALDDGQAIVSMKKPILETYHTFDQNDFKMILEVIQNRPQNNTKTVSESTTKF